MKRHNPFPAGMVTMALGLGLNGVTSYVFLAIAARRLSVADHDALAVLWAFVFIAGPGFFQPLEQEVGRIISSRRSIGQGAGPLVREASYVGLGLLVVLLVLVGVTSPWTIDRVFNGKGVLLLGLVLSLMGYCAGHLVRGVLAGHGRFAAYSRFFAAEGIGRLVLVAVPVLAGVKHLLPYALALGLAPFVAVGVATWGQRGISEPGPEAHLGDLSRALGSLLAASVFTALLLNVGPIVVSALSDDADHEAGRFLNALVVARVPLFFFQAVQAALLPQLAGLHGAGEHHELWHGLRRLLIAVGALVGVAVVGMGTLGPFVVKTLFGESFAVTHQDMALLALSSGMFMLALALAQGLIAIGGQGPTARGWLAGVVAFPIALLFGEDAFMRVEIALLAAVFTAAAAMYLQLRWVLHHEHEVRFAPAAS